MNWLFIWQCVLIVVMSFFGICLGVTIVAGVIVGCENVGTWWRRRRA